MMRATTVAALMQMKGRLWQRSLKRRNAISDCATCTEIQTEWSHINRKWEKKISKEYNSTNQTPLTQRVDRALGAMADPCCMKPPTGNQKLLPREYWLISRLQRPLMQGWGLYHSYGVNLGGDRRKIRAGVVPNGAK